VEITKVFAKYPERKNFSIRARAKVGEYVFVHFLTPVTLEIGGKKTEVFPGGCIIWDSGEVRRFSSPERILIHDWFHATGDVPDVIGTYGLEFGKVYYPEFDSFITDCISQMYFEWTLKKKFYSEICAHKAHEVFALIARNSEKNDTDIEIDENTYNLFIKLRKEVHDAFCEDWTVERMAARIGFSPSRFFAIYKKIFRISPKKDLISCRLLHARSLAEEKHYTVQQIAEMSGFSNVFHFIRIFKREFGVAPGHISNSNEVQETPPN
jgi:AraC-like DNA-binding protein